jgi:hypothetical protein
MNTAYIVGAFLSLMFIELSIGRVLDTQADHAKALVLVAKILEQKCGGAR